MRSIVWKAILTNWYEVSSRANFQVSRRLGNSSNGFHFSFMLRQAQLTARYISRPRAHHHRLYATLPSPSPTPSPSVPPTHPQVKRAKQSKLSLDPKPLIVTPTSERHDALPTPPSSAVSSAAQSKPANHSEVVPEPAGVKEMVQGDIQHAEALGILKPTPPDASPSRRLFHKAIELTVRLS